MRKGSQHITIFKKLTLTINITKYKKNNIIFLLINCPIHIYNTQPLMVKSFTPANFAKKYDLVNTLPGPLPGPWKGPG
jgi:hypothetical protein